jgi:NAD(P)-dependent dehydrogenase (short-subunit alcohol dehydrogenase family)
MLCSAGFGTAAVTARAVLVIGAQGVLGTALVRAFEDRGWQVHRGARRPDSSSARLVDLDRPETVAEAIADVDLVIDPVPHPDMTPERIVLREGGALIDVSARPAAAGRRLREETTEARGVVVLNAGRMPGISNLAAAHLLAAHPDADAVEMVFSFSASGVSGAAGGEFVHGHLTSVRHHRTAVIPFSAPLGPRRCLEYAESENGWLGELPQGRTVTTYARFAPRALNGALLALNKLRLMSTLPLGAFVPSDKPNGEATTEHLTEWIAVRRNGTCLGACTIEGAGGYRVTAAATAVLADSLVATGADRPGCFDPQELFTLEDLQAELRAGGIDVVRQAVTDARATAA